MKESDNRKDYSAERDEIRRKYEKKKHKRRISTSSVIIVVLFLVVIILIVLLIKLLSGIDLTGGKKEENRTPADTGSISSRVDNATGHSSESDTESTYIPDEAYVDEIRYANLHMGDSWYSGDIYKPVCADVPDEYFEEVCFIGDSRTKGLLEYSELPRWRGFYKVGSTAAAACVENEYTLDGANYTNILDIIERVDYDIYYVGYGTNELGYGNSDKFIEELRVVIDRIKEYHPDAIIYVENVLPMGESYSANNPSFSNSRAEIYNEALKRMCQEYGDLIYLDIASSMRDPDTGAAKSDYIGDGLHYTVEGCREILKFIRGAVVEKR